MLGTSSPLDVYSDQSVQHCTSGKRDCHLEYCLETCKETSIPAKCCQLCIARSKWQCQPGRDTSSGQDVTLSLSTRQRALLCLCSATLVTVLLGICKPGSVH